VLVQAVGQPRRRRQEFSGFIDGRGGGRGGEDWMLMDTLPSANDYGFYRRGHGYNSMDEHEEYGVFVPSGPPEPKYVNGKRVMVNSEIK
jgi:hypothetical protein